MTSRRRSRDARRTLRSTATRRFIRQDSLRWVTVLMMSLDELTFELERFELQDGARLTVRGRWLGVRGQRFMRPTLHVRVGDRERRVIAVLDHKPWAPDAAGAWIAAFAWG